ncbi:MAG: RteC domain-containing protein [Bacteroidota bacterium]|nr:RteC domain-containing protein [Bacteroidota bacterium]
MMDRLTQTPFFLMLAQLEPSPAAEELALAYKEFMHQLMEVCLQTKESVPAFFILNFSSVEIVLLQQERKADNSRQNNPVDQFLLKALLSVSGALEWLKSHEPGHQQNTQKHQAPEFTPQWTADGIGLLEMAMALHERRAINNGEVSITAMANFFFNLFDMKPGNFFSTYGVMRTRANSRTLFLDELKSSLENKMDRDDNKEIRHRKRK